MNDMSIKFLVVEDNELDLEKITRSFNKLKISNDVIHVNNAMEALDVLRGVNGKAKLASPYIFILDLNMPKMTGIEFLGELRGDPDIAHSPVFILSTSDRQKDIDAAYAFNICGYIVKPVKIAEMIEALSTLDGYWKLSELPAGPPKTKLA